MTRLIYFIAFVIGLVIVMNISDYQGQPVSNAKFDFEKKAASNYEKQKEIHELLHPKPVEKEEKKVVVEKVLVELTTPELQNGSDLYKKCITCHGKRGEGKKSQKAPAIGGQYDWYIALQISNMKSGERINKVMNPYIRNLSEQDIKDLANYISKLPHMGK
ncbi:MAG: hypothetical protein CME63_12530 [Halobacteriovoraceae bacterium]|nr:hypothetical protein [Halobacteriovoraceae bacterium]MBC98568.1 hypothetical protein [Halobacteriovoraceae bacterium]|tara:strand:- start:4920 stop:5402 length:483 start_codon:yes stop_codon:yes gene_type:complete